MTENRENWLYPDASGLYFPHDGFIMRASDGKQYDYEEECELLNEYLKDVLRLEEEVDYYKTKCSSLEEGLFQQDREIAKLKKENNELQLIKQFAENNGICIFNIEDAFRRCWNDNGKLVEENQFLKKQLNIYRDASKVDAREYKELLEDIDESYEDNLKLEKENKELKEEVQLLKEGMEAYENAIPYVCDCEQVNDIRSEMCDFRMKQNEFYKEHPSRCIVVIDGVRYE